MRAGNRQIISSFSYISKGFHIKRAGALQVVISSSINCSVPPIHSVQTQNQAFKFLLRQREISQSSAWQETPAHCSPTTAPYCFRHREAKGTGNWRQQQELRSAPFHATVHLPHGRTNHKNPHKRALQSGKAGVLQLLNVT